MSGRLERQERKALHPRAGEVFKMVPSHRTLGRGCLGVEWSGLVVSAYSTSK